jgi:hypothetical protein
MSLFSFEEICENCKNAIWHNCPECYGDKIKFCHCKINVEELISHYVRKGCDYYTYNKKENKE